MIGFVFIHVLEKSVYQHIGDKSEFVYYTATFEAIGLVVYGLLLGVIITVFFDAYGDEAYFFLVPFYFRAFGVAVYSEQVSEQIGSKLDAKLNSIFQPAAPIIGTFFSLLLITKETHRFLVFAITAGFILYIIVRDMIPFGREAKPV